MCRVRRGVGDEGPPKPCMSSVSDLPKQQAAEEVGVMFLAGKRLSSRLDGRRVDWLVLCRMRCCGKVRRTSCHVEVLQDLTDSGCLQHLAIRGQGCKMVPRASNLCQDELRSADRADQPLESQKVANQKSIACHKASSITFLVSLLASTKIVHYRPL